ncbi:ATP-binding cassette domain-containing protein [Microbacterium sp. NPDC058345]|uniref:ATP-binding cassette domain-containing protein n=1 Tax=Microbacterium sp. NPDC058345 TaxID=3346455 RepID=UPI00364DDA56
MPAGQVLEFARVTKRFGAVTAVSDLSVRVEPGVVTGFLGPNGAGKTTTLRMLLGQIRPTSGVATIGGVSYAELRNPLRTIGAVLEEAAYRPRRTASRQLMIAAKANAIPAERVDAVLRLVGLQDDADTRIGGFSLGMRQRLSVATALLGDPGALVLDEPANGLDPEGIRWMRMLMRRLADEGRTVLVSSHVLSEIEQVADNVVVLSKGRAVYSGSIDDLADPTGGAVIVDAEDRAALAAALSAAGLSFDVLRSGLTVRESDAASVGAVAASAGVALTTLQQRGPSLEEVFLDLVYGRRADSPRLDEVANPVAHAPLDAGIASTPGGTALVAGSAPLAGAAAAVGAGAGLLPGATAGQADAAAGADSDAEQTEAVGARAAARADAEAVGADAEAGPVDDSAGAEADAAEGSADETAEDAEEDLPGTDAAPEQVDQEVAEPDAVSDQSAQGPDREDAAPAESAQGAEGDESAAEGEEAAGPAQAAENEESAEHEDASGGSAPSGEHRDSTAAEQQAGDGDDDDPSTAMFTVPSELWAPRSAQESATASDEPTTDVLPLATQAVSLPPVGEQSTFTELITGIPAATPEDAASDTTEPPATTSAFSVFSPILSEEEEDDTDSTVDDEDDPRLTAMRTSLSSAASRFFEGPAPEYPYGDAPDDGRSDSDVQPAQDAQHAQPAQDARPAQDAQRDGSEPQPAQDEQFDSADDATRVIGIVTGSEDASADHSDRDHGPHDDDHENDRHDG